MSFLVIFVGACAFALSVQGHMRLDYPEARSTSYGIKSGPCGGDTDDWSGSFTDVYPGTLTLTVQESVYHSGAPYSIRLSQYENDTYDCILLDHIPQHATSGSSTMYINITIPNVNCDKCAIQVISFMTDKVDDGECCDYDIDGRSGSCFSNYHSCANINIIADSSASDYVSDRKDLICEQPSEWPFRTWTTNIYTQEESSTHWQTISSNVLMLIIPGSNVTNPCGDSEPSTSTGTTMTTTIGTTMDSTIGTSIINTNTQTRTSMIKTSETRAPTHNTYVDNTNNNNNNNNNNNDTDYTGTIDTGAMTSQSSVLLVLRMVTWISPMILTFQSV